MPIGQYVDSLSAGVILATIGASLAMIFAAVMMLRPSWTDAGRNGVVLGALILFLLISLRTFVPSFLCQQTPLFPPGTELLFCFLLPVCVYLGALLGWPYLREVNDRIPLAWTIWPQTFRSMGGLFLMKWAVGGMPGGFAWPAGVGDLLVGCTAPWVTWRVLQGRYSKNGLILWSLLGVLDFAIAFSTGFAFNTPDRYPLILIPGYLVPLAIVFHVSSLRCLSREPSPPGASDRSASQPESAAGAAD